ncbi:hypothetical protein BJ085DRAFT_35539 [Dimargaris cristalligena]|uniref:Carrier domain-containing protein n=1 Tax=Dimargaris cristalligena TaxID=215637 RepID=A0A4P9ZSQ6_9FUNG|nr:hypothetical protein BJ085DRAFT_35539 [Dimargaris cristalligena]|eukprot:RKP35851.1 hypothetical protein BJ085DRAFT_35539 [Dimargaris cristalligena]
MWAIDEPEIRRTLTLTRPYISSVRQYSLDHSLALDSPQTACGYILEVLDDHGHPCPPGVVGRLSLLDTLNSNQTRPLKQPALGYRDTADMVHILGPAEQRVIIRHQQVHFGTLVRKLTEVGAQSSRHLVLPDGQLVVLVSNVAEVELIRLKSIMVPPVIPSALVPDEIISTSAFPHVTDLNDQLLPHFAKAYLTARPAYSDQSLSEYEWWLIVVVNELYASSNHSSVGNIDTAPLMSTSRIPLAHLDLLQYRIRQKFGVAVGLGEFIKHTEIRTLASIVERFINQGTDEQSPDFTIEDAVIAPLDMSPLYNRAISVTSHQQRVWSLSRLSNPSSAFYHHCTITSKAPLQLVEVQWTIDHLTTVFESLRYRFLSVRGVLTCHVLPRVSIGVTEHQLPSSQVFDGDQFDVHVPQFDLNRCELVQIDLYQLPMDTAYNKSSVIGIRVHEILGPTNEFDEIVRTLTNQLVGHSPRLPNVQFMKTCSTSEPTKADLNYWSTLLQNPPAELALPTDQPRPLVPTFLCNVAETGVEQQFLDTVQEQTSKESVKEHGIWSSLFATFLLRLTGQTDLIMDLSGPFIENGDTSVGMKALSVLAQPLRVKGEPSLDFPEIVGQLAHQIVDSQLHPLPLMDTLAPHLSLEGQHRISGLSRISVSYHHPAGPGGNSTAVRCVRPRLPRTMFPYDLQLVVDCHDHTPICQLRFNQSLFNVDTANRLLHNFMAYAHSVVVAHQRWSTASLICPTEANLIRDKFTLGPPNSVTRENPHLSVLDLFLDMVQKYPNRVATEIANVTYTYAQLSRRIFVLVERLQRANVQPCDKVGVIVTNHPDAVMCILAVWGVGAVYVPVDFKLPTARQKYIVDTAGCTCIVNASGTSTEWNEAIFIDGLSDDIESTTTASSLHPIQPTDLAYIVFTSGSTGLPKGVIIEHRSLLNMLTSPTLEMLQQPGTRTMNGMAAGFDGFFLNTLLPLCYGSTLVFYGDDLPGTLKTVQQTILLPSIISTLNPHDYTNLNSLLVGGEHLPRELASQWSTVTTFYNIYGPTEATIICLMIEVPSSGCVPIGRPMADYECYILDENLLVVPIGAVGEICIGGVGVALGYINRPDLNPIKFVDNPFTKHGKIYRTGDLGRWLPDGQVMCLGRKDSQVKLRGFRIELDEIRSVLMRQPWVQDCVVFVHDQFLVSYVFSDSTASENTLRSSVADQLPSYMVPSYIIGLPKVPLTTNGKCDTQFLRTHFADHLATQRQQVPLVDSGSEEDEPLTVLIQALCEVLGLSPSQVNPNLTFIKIGGDSISAIQVSSKCRQFGFSLPTSGLLGSRPLCDASKEMSHILPSSGKASQFHHVEYHTKFPLTPIQQWFFDHPWSNPNHFNMSFALELTRPLTIAELTPALLRLINCHDMLRCQFTQVPHGLPGQWSQEIIPPFAELPIPIVEFGVSPSSLPEKLISIQASLDITQGHHLAAGLITISDGDSNTPVSNGSRLTSISPPFKRQLLFLTIHHLVVDLVSWSILLEDLAHILDGQSPAPQPLEFATWATELVDWAKLDMSNANPSHPQATPQSSFLPLAGPDCLALNTQANTLCQSVTLDSALSDAILHIDTGGIRPLDLMLTGLFQALHFISQAPTITIFNESHGRHPWQSNIDPSRTVSWFTSIFPCRAQVDAGTTLLDYLKQAKQALRSSSGTQGLKPGLQQLLHRPQNTTSDEQPYSPMDVCFNYLGHTTSNGTLSMHGRAPWTPLPELTTTLAICDPSELRAQILEVIGLPTPGGLTFMIYYCPQVIPTGVIESLLDHLRQSLVDIVQCLDQSHHPSLWTPSDFPSLNTTLSELAKLEAELSTVGLSPHDVEDLYPMLPMQQGLWTATAKDPTKYLVQFVFTVTGISDQTQLEIATRAMVADNTILRTVFLTTWSNSRCDGVQIIPRTPRFDWHVLHEWADMGASSEDDFLQSNRARGFALDGPLLRVYVMQLSPSSFRYLLTVHHALVDGWSGSLMIQQLRSRLQNESPAHVNDALSFCDYAGYYLNTYNPEAEPFWRGYLQGVDNPTDLELPKPSDISKPSKAEFHFTLFSDYDRVQRVARHLGYTPYTLIKTAWAILLKRYTGQADIIYGITVSGRTLPLAGIDSLLGCLINTVPFRVQFDSDLAVSQLVSSINDTTQQMAPFEHYHLSNINGWVDGEVRPSDTFNTLMVFENYPDTGLGDLSHPITFTENKTVESAEYPMAVIARVDHDEITACLNWDASQFGQCYVETLSQHFCTLFDGLVCALADSEKHSLVDDLPMLSANDIVLVTEQFARPTLAIDFDACVPSLFADTAKATPDTVAIEYKEMQWTYRELYNQTINLTHRLQHYGVQHEAPVGLLIDRLPSTVAAFLGVLQAGAAFVPLDPAFPVDRINYIVEDCGIKLVLTNTADQTKLDSIRLALIRPTDLSHILYTSGTTGRPKGVQLEHRLMANFVQQAESTVCITRGLRLMQNMALTFDGALIEIFTGLCKGSTIVIRTDILDTLPLVEALVTTPTVLASLDPSKYPKLKKVISGGEALPRQVAELWANHCRVFNMYGPTECLLSHTIEYKIGNVPTVGRPIPNTEAYILDQNLRPVPIGVRGEICIAGIQVTRGYVNLPELNRERLLPNPFTDKGLLYRTGDNGRWLIDGTVEYFSRHDDQVKIRGHRVEPQEIETVLLSHPDVKSTAVVIASRKIYAFICPGSVSVESVKSHIGRILPAYMNPNAIFKIDELPRNTNGKTDKHVLNAKIAELTSMDIGRAITAPQNPMQALAIEALSQTLDVPCSEIDIYDSFFQHGGDSISAIRLSSLCRDRGLYITIAQVFKCSNIVELAECASDHSKSDGPLERHSSTHYTPYSLLGEVGAPSFVTDSLLQEATSQLKLGLDEVTDILPVSGLQLGFLVNTLKDPSSYMVQESFTISGDLDLDRLQNAWHRLAEYHDILRTKFFQPASLPNHSFLQVITKWCDIEWSIHTDVADDWSALEKTYFATDRQRGFTFEGPLLRIALFTSPSTDIYRHLCFFTFHHALLDAWSWNIVLAELVDLYHGTEPTPTTQFSNYISYLQNADQFQLQQYWQTALVNARPTPSIHFPVYATQSPVCKYGVHRNTLSSNLASLHAFCRQQRITLNSLLRGVWALTLSRYLGVSDDISFGVLTSGRNVPVSDIQNMVGMCINTLPFRVSLDLQTTISSFVQRVHCQSGELTVSEQCGLLDIYKLGKISRETKLFNSLMLYDNFPPSASGTPNPDITFKLHGGQNFTEYAYTVSFLDNGDNLDCRVVYDETHCDATYANYLVQYIDHCLFVMVNDPCLSLGDLMTLPTDEARLVDKWAQGPVREFPQRHWLAYQLFSQHVSSRPEAIALETASQQFTYSETYHRSCCIALALQQRGFKPGNLAALVFTKLADFIFSYLGVLLVGGVCVPMDATNAADRLQYTYGLLDDPWLLSTAYHFDNIRDHVSVVEDRCCLVDILDHSGVPTNLFRPDTSRSSSDLAYIMFTSGTTGRPKGIPVRHESLVNFTLSNCETVQLDSNCRFLQLLNTSFDGCLLEIFGAFHCGGTLVLQDGNLPETLARVNTCFLIPSMLSVIDIEAYPNLKTVFIGGELVPLNVAHRWCERVRLFNIYGPTEITIVCHAERVRSSEPLSIGRSLANIQGYILDDQLRPVPVGVPGELCIGGVGVSSGYWKQPELTVNSFVPNPFGRGYLYRSGDLVCWLSSGKVQFISRKDSQVKLRGYRIELSEIENTASLVEGVTNAVACVTQQQLVLYIAPSSVDIVALQTQIISKLPQYMVPNFIVPLDCIPMTNVGKADRKALQVRPLPMDTTDEAVDIDSLSSTFLLMREALADTLKVDPKRATPSASFLRLGGDSISAIQFSNRCKRLGLQLSVADILKHTQLSVMEQYVHLADSENTARIQYMEPIGSIPLTAVQRYALEEYQFINQFNQSMLLKCRQTLTRPMLRQALTNLMAHHDILRIRLEHSNGQWQQRALPIPIDMTSCLSRFVFIEEATVTLDQYPAWVNNMQRTISIEHGPTVACGLLTLDSEQYVYMTIHHFAVDFVSWRIILEDLEALLTNQSMPAKTMPFREWATQVHAYAQTLSDTTWPGPRLKNS